MQAAGTSSRAFEGSDAVEMARAMAKLKSYFTVFGVLMLIGTIVRVGGIFRIGPA